MYELKFKTKYELGQTVYVYSNSAKGEFTIASITFHIDRDDISINYFSDKGVIASERDLFPSKEEFIKTL